MRRVFVDIVGGTAKSHNALGAGGGRIIAGEINIGGGLVSPRLDLHALGYTHRIINRSNRGRR